MTTVHFDLHSDHIALCDLLKGAGIVDSSGAGKHLVSLGGVRVNGQPETRKTAKIRAGQVVDCGGVCIHITSALGNTPANRPVVK